jgi:23S rRNA (guanosine2251-2'-O)-methyltransferase
MSDQLYKILQCDEPGCRFRFPMLDDARNHIDCPRCGMPTKVAVAPFSNQPPRKVSIEKDKYRICGLLDNIRSAYNVGSMIRTASAAGFGHLYLCGITPTPEHPKVAKTALGAEEYVSWSHHNNSIDAAARLHAAGHHLIAFEGGSQSQWLSDFLGTEQAMPVSMIVGNELSGVDPALLEMCDQVLALPMLGSKNSLNVTVAFGIAAYYLQYFPLLNTNLL